MRHSYSKKYLSKIQTKQVWRYIPIIIALREAETGGWWVQPQLRQFSNLVRLCLEIKNNKDWVSAQGKGPVQSPVPHLPAPKNVESKGKK